MPSGRIRDSSGYLYDCVHVHHHPWISYSVFVRLILRYRRYHTYRFLLFPVSSFRFGRLAGPPHRLSWRVFGCLSSDCFLIYRHVVYSADERCFACFSIGRSRSFVVQMLRYRISFDTRARRSTLVATPRAIGPFSPPRCR